MKTLRLVLIGAVAAVAGFALQSCSTPQPPPECSVTAGAAAFGVTNYYAVLKKTSQTGACSADTDLTALEMGLQRFAPADGGAFQVGLRPSRIVDMWNGLVFSADQDTSNDCSLYDDVGDCTGCVDPGSNPGPDDNVCMYVPDPVYRTDPANDDGKKFTVLSPFAKTPKAGLCQISDVAVTAAWQAETIDLSDGGTQVFPAIDTKLEFSEFNVIMSAKAPGTAFTAKLKYTEGTCVANYDVKGFWPIVGCETDVHCDPKADPDAGRIFGSGISPDFAPKCNTTLGVCEPSVDYATLAK